MQANYSKVSRLLSVASLAERLLSVFGLLATFLHKPSAALSEEMDLRINNGRNGREPVLSRELPSPRLDLRAFTLVEVMVVMMLLTTLIMSSAAGIIAMDRSSRRLADYTAAMAVAEAKMSSIRAASYVPPTAPFGASTVYLTNSSSISLAKAGTNFLVTGTVLSKIQPVSAGHLVTVTATFQEPNQSFSVTLQSVVNRYSGGSQ